MKVSNYKFISYKMSEKVFLSTIFIFLKKSNKKGVNFKKTGKIKDVY